MVCLFTVEGKTFSRDVSGGMWRIKGITGSGMQTSFLITRIFGSNK